MRFLTLPPLVVILLLVFLWFLLLVLVLWFVMGPRRGGYTDRTPSTNEEAQRKGRRDNPAPPPRPRVVRQPAPQATPQNAPQTTPQDDAFDGFNRNRDRRDDFDF